MLAEIVGDVVEIMGLEAEHDGMLTILDCENVGVVTTGVDDEVAGDVGKGCKEGAIVVDVDPCSGDWMDDWGEELFEGTNVKDVLRLGMQDWVYIWRGMSVAIECGCGEV